MRWGAARTPVALGPGVKDALTLSFSLSFFGIKSKKGAVTCRMEHVRFGRKEKDKPPEDLTVASSSPLSAPPSLLVPCQSGHGGPRRRLPVSAPRRRLPVSPPWLPRPRVCPRLHLHGITSKGYPPARVLTAVSPVYFASSSQCLPYIGSHWRNTRDQLRQGRVRTGRPCPAIFPRLFFPTSLSCYYRGGRGGREGR